MEIRTCEEYVLRELTKAQERIAELEIELALASSKLDKLDKQVNDAKKDCEYENLCKELAKALEYDAKTCAFSLTTLNLPSSSRLWRELRDIYNNYKGEE